MSRAPLTISLAPTLPTLGAFALALLPALSGVARAESRVAVRGAYYREASTRVVQPVVELTKDLPHGLDIGARYLLDAITSASVAAGVETDDLFTEYRSEAGLSVGKILGRSRIGVSYRYSAESDYWSHAFSLSLTHRVWGDSGTIALAAGRGFDSVSGRTITVPCEPTTGRYCFLDIYFGGFSYSQVLSPHVVAQAGYELTYLDGYQGNPYRQVPGQGVERLPERRLRHTASARVATYVPWTGTGVQVHYRFYRDQYPGWQEAGLAEDPWQVASHTAEGRVYQALGQDLELRVAYRWYSQGGATFFCDTPACYGPSAPFYATDPKLAALNTQFAEGKLTWEAAALRGVPFFGWFASGAFEASYGHYFQATMYGNAHLLQLGYSMPL